MSKRNHTKKTKQKRKPTEEELREFETQFVDEELPDEYWENVKPYEEELLESGDTEAIASFMTQKYLAKISKLFYDYRKKHRLSQAELAAKLGVKQPVISRIESASWNPSIEVLVLYLTKLGYSLEDVLKKEQERNYEIEIIRESTIVLINDPEDLPVVVKVSTERSKGVFEMNYVYENEGGHSVWEQKNQMS